VTPDDAAGARPGLSLAVPPLTSAPTNAYFCGPMRLPFELSLAMRYLRPKRTFVSVITLISDRLLAWRTPGRRKKSAAESGSAER
jgi:hypothetical protein